MTPSQQNAADLFNYEGGRLARRNNLPISKLCGSEAVLVYRNYRDAMSRQMVAYFDGWYDQDVDLTLEVS